MNLKDMNNVHVAVAGKHVLTPRGVVLVDANDQTTVPLSEIVAMYNEATTKMAALHKVIVDWELVPVGKNGT